MGIRHRSATMMVYGRVSGSGSKPVDNSLPESRLSPAFVSTLTHRSLKLEIISRRLPLDVFSCFAVYKLCVASQNDGPLF